MRNMAPGEIIEKRRVGSNAKQKMKPPKRSRRNTEYFQAGIFCFETGFQRHNEVGEKGAYNQLQWTDGSKTWEPLKNLENSVECQQQLATFWESVRRTRYLNSRRQLAQQMRLCYGNRRMKILGVAEAGRKIKKGNSRTRVENHTYARPCQCGVINDDTGYCTLIGGNSLSRLRK